MFSNASECGGSWGVAYCYPYRYFQQSFRMVSSPVLLKEEQTFTYGQTSADFSKRLTSYSYLPNTILAPVSVEVQGNDNSFNKKTSLYPQILLA
ncbi:hypothetical protein [Paraflavitalea speifideaquila]|uniref:hypothetical protein n=1 Tax=Paraflavitalea speifideaquila TaxID=3076558 RepID=UPI0028EC1317|nr:hypothetical protein [Paraflavitalea speifideiaquila]